MSAKVITGALIRITVRPKPDGQVTEIGRAMAMNIQEQYRVTPVYGIGKLTAQELPVLQYAGAFSVQQFAFSTTALQNLMAQFNRQGGPGVATKDAFVKQLLYTDGIDVTISRREKQNGTEVEVPLAKINGAICTGESMVIQENQIVVRDGSFIFADPVSV